MAVRWQMNWGRRAEGGREPGRVRVALTRLGGGQVACPILDPVWKVELACFSVDPLWERAESPSSLPAWKDSLYPEMEKTRGGRG